MNNVLEGTVTKALIRKMQEFNQICKNILFKHFNREGHSGFLEIVSVRLLYVRMMVKILKLEKITG